ncbi:MAG: ATP-binding protein [Patescibacteria group bacterium]
MLPLIIYKIIFGVTTFAAGAILAGVYLKKEQKKSIDKFFGLLMGSFLIWGSGRFVLLSTNSQENLDLWLHILYIGSILVHLFFLHFIFIYLGVNIRFKKLLIFFYSLNLFLLLVNIYDYIFGTTYFLGPMISKLQFVNYETPGPLYLLHLLNYLVIPSLALALMLMAYRKWEGSQLQQLKFVIFSSVLGFFGGNSVVPLVYGIKLEPFLLVLVPFYLISLAYAIRQHHLFNIKTVATEMLVLILWVFLIARIFLAETFSDQVVDVSLLLAMILVGVLLIRSVNKEVKTREKVEVLAQELGVANDKLRELDRQKSEFLSIASHQLRSPLTAIKGYSSMILEGSFGAIEAKMREAIERIYLSSERLVIIIEDFLNVSRIEQGRMQYDFSTVNLEELTDGVIKELEPNITRAKLKISFNKKSEGPFFTQADFGKVRQMVTNIIDNAVKYTPEGGITVSIEHNKEKRTILISIADTGIGIAPDVLPTLFQKFTRAKGANTVNTQGTGLGLYVVKKLMKAHKGNVWVDSLGIGKGSTFYLEFIAE